MTYVKGPWKVYQEQPHYYSIGTDYVNDRGRDQNIVRNVRREANARLMAAAPEMLEALKHIAEALRGAQVCDNETGDNIPVDRLGIVELIAKAEGVQVSAAPTSASQPA